MGTGPLMVWQLLAIPLILLLCVCSSICAPEALTRSQAYDRSTAEFYSSIEQKAGSYAHPVTKALLGLPYCNFSGSDAILTAGKWYKDEDGDYFFEPDTCRIRRVSAEAARSCLSGKHVAFVGDSITRYEYLSLVHFLSKKQYMERYGASVSGDPSLVIERDWGSWEDFFAGGKARIAAAVDAEADELCDCYRPNGVVMANIREHREFMLHQHGDAPVRISYHFSYNYPSVEESMLQKLIQLFACGAQHPDVVVLNMGHWLHGDGSVLNKQDASWLHRLHGTILRSASHLVAAMDSLRAVLYWQTTTPKRGYDSSAMAYSQAVDDLESTLQETLGQAENWQVLDVRSIAKTSLDQNLDIYWDELHFLPVMYEQFNDLLLHKVCNMV